MSLKIYNDWPRYNRIIDWLYSKVLHFLKGKNIICDQDVAVIKKIEQKAYPQRMRGYRYVENTADLVDALECNDAAQIDYVIQDGVYLLSVRHYNCVDVYDCASETKNAVRFFVLHSFCLRNTKKRLSM